MKVDIEKTKVINVKKEKVFSALKDFKQWRAWSPWMIIEPDAKTTVSDDEQSYFWSGDLVGEGEIKLTNFQTNESLSYDLSFVKPNKSKAKVNFFLEDLGDKTEVRWRINFSLPFFLFWMKNFLKAYIGMDYDRGLSLLKDYCEKGYVESKVKDEGNVAVSGFNYIGIKSQCDLKEIGPSMERDFEKLMKHSDGESKAFSIYHKFDAVKQTCIYTAGVSYSGEAPKGFVKGSLKGGKALKVSHVGPYHHLGNAWSLGMTKVRMKRIKQSKKLDPIEFYVNDPSKVDAKDLETNIYFPLKS